MRLRGFCRIIDGEKGKSKDCCYQCLHPQGNPLKTHTFSGDPPTLAGRLGFIYYEATAPFPLVLEHTIFYFCPPRVKSLFPQSWGSPAIKSCWHSRKDFLGIPDILGKPDMGLRTFTTVEEHFWYYCSPVHELPIRLIWDLILQWLYLSYCLGAASSLSLDVKYVFLMGCSILLMTVQSVQFSSVT